LLSELLLPTLAGILILPLPEEQFFNCGEGFFRAGGQASIDTQDDIAFLKADTAKYAAVVKKSKITAE
jgi:hypothetical protein